jgi:hypothetical protein
MPEFVLMPSGGDISGNGVRLGLCYSSLPKIAQIYHIAQWNERFFWSYIADIRLGRYHRVM